MEHKAGVPKGGTFILVYVDHRSIFESMREANKFLNISEIINSVYQAKEIGSDLLKQIYHIISGSLNKSIDISEEVKSELMNKVVKRIPSKEKIYSITEGTIIADFIFAILVHG